MKGPPPRGPPGGLFRPSVIGCSSFNAAFSPHGELSPPAAPRCSQLSSQHCSVGLSQSATAASPPRHRRTSHPSGSHQRNPPHREHHRPRIQRAPPHTVTTPNMDYSIRAANVEDCKDISRMILELAEYEKIAEHVKITQRDLEQDGFSKNPFFHGIIAEVPEQHKTKEGHTKIGYALYFFSYSSWSGRAVFMEDLYVMPEFRGKGIGKALMSKVAQLGLAAGCHLLDFTVLDWNKSSLDFYHSQGCVDITANMGYHLMRCEGEALQHLAQP